MSKKNMYGCVVVVNTATNFQKIFEYHGPKEQIAMIISANKCIKRLSLCSSLGCYKPVILNRTTKKDILCH